MNKPSEVRPARAQEDFLMETLAKPINVINLLNNQDWVETHQNIKGEAAHRLSFVLEIEFNKKARYTNKLYCKPKQMAALMKRDVSQFKRGRKALIKLGIWNYHLGGFTKQGQRKPGYFSIPARFLSQGAKSAPSMNSTASKNSKEIAKNTKSLKQAQGADPAPSLKFTATKVKVTSTNKKPVTQGAKSAPYNLNNNRLKIIDDETYKTIQKLKRAKKPFLYSPNSPTFRQQIRELTILLTKIDNKHLNVLIQKLIDNPTIKDAPNYLIQSIKNDITARHQAKVTATWYFKRPKKVVEKGTDWSKKKATVDPNIDPQKLHEFFVKFEKEHGMTN